MNIVEQKNITIANLTRAVIDTTASEVVETITLIVDTNDYTHGFKIAYDDVTYEPLMGRYWRASLLPVTTGKDKRTYFESLLSPEQFNAVLKWRGLEAKNNAYIRDINITFKKDPKKGQMIDL